MAIIHKVMLSQDSFRKLVKGEIVTIWDLSDGNEKIEIALSDIGFRIMRQIINDAEKDAQYVPQEHPSGD